MVGGGELVYVGLGTDRQGREVGRPVAGLVGYLEALLEKVVSVGLSVVEVGLKVSEVHSRIYCLAVCSPAVVAAAVVDVVPAPPEIAGAARALRPS